MDNSKQHVHSFIRPFPPLARDTPIGLNAVINQPHATHEIPCTRKNLLRISEMSLDYFNITPVTYIILHSLKKSIHFEYREWRSKSKLQEERNKAQRPVINGGPPSRAPAGPIIVQPPARPLLLPPTIAPVSFTAGQGLHRAIYRHNEFKGPEGEGRGGDQEKVAIPPSHGRVKKALLLLLLLLLRSRDNESSTSFRSSGRGACSTVTLHRHHRPLLRGSLDDWGSV